MKIGIRREDKSIWERRSPLTPEDLRDLAAAGISAAVETSGHRIFPDAEFEAAGIPVQPNLADCDRILGVKEIPAEAFESGKTYLFFAHVIKGQAFNMPMLRAMMVKGVNLFDYERIVDADGRRLIFFGRHAGLAGMVDTLWTLGRRLRTEGIASPLDRLRQMRDYPDLAAAMAAMAELREAIRREGVPKAIHPLVVGRVGSGNAGRGAGEILDAVGAEPRAAADLPLPDDAPRNRIYQIPFRKADWLRPREPERTFNLVEYLRFGRERYRSAFPDFARHLTALVNGMYWDDRYPGLLSAEDFRALWAGPSPPRLRVVGDISCDVGGSLACTVRASDPGNPVYVYDPRTGETADGTTGFGPAVMAVYMLPAEIPRESSVHFSGVLKPFVPALAAADFSVPFPDIALPPPLRRAMILHRGELTPEYRYLEAHVGNAGPAARAADGDRS